MSSVSDALAATIAITAALATVVLAILIGLSSPQATEPSASCREWTDSCMVCSRQPAGIACSTPGIACTPRPLQCLRR
ncbi:hypothetical protein [Microvirga puerhi]|uniref:Uncharacterized protein n=1 Tax=Microvirga puerhi TaxID=2876078 RepID=A0ABS7VNJ7_9HYPH|nr:hypothetical protein [Microvirga puerhi]MBZ6076705.1 hypothetical protein [Microvirga puerhi]